MTASYAFNWHAVPVFIAAALVLVFGIVLWIKKSEAEVSRHFLILSLGIFVWLFSTAMGYLAVDPVLAQRWFALDNAGVMFISPSFFGFSACLTRSGHQAGIRWGYLLASCFALFSCLQLFPIQGVRKFTWGYFPQWSFLGSIPFFLFFFGFMVSAFLVLRRALRETKSQRERNQIRYVLAAFGIAYFGSVDYLATFGYAVYPFGFIPIFALVATLFYAVVRHSLLDITLIIRRTVLYSCVMGILAIVYLATVALSMRIFQGLTGYQTLFSSAIAATLTTLGFQPLRRRIQQFLDQKFFRQYIDREEKLYELSRDVITHSTPEAMAQALMRVLSDVLHPKAGVLYLRAPDGNGFVRSSLLGDASTPERMEEENPLAKYSVNHPQPFVQSDEERLGESRNTRRTRDSVRPAA